MRKSTIVASVRLPSAQHKRLAELAREAGVTRGQLLRGFVDRVEQDPGIIRDFVPDVRNDKGAAKVSQAHGASV